MQQDLIAPSVQLALTKELLLAMEAKGIEQQQQQQEIQLLRHMCWLSRQAPPTGSVPTTTALSYVGTPLEPVVQAGHPELPQQQPMDTLEVPAQSSTSFASHNQGHL